MLSIVLLIIVTMIGGYFAFRYLFLIFAMKKIRKDINDLKKDLTQNQIIHLPIPNKHLQQLLCSFNDILDEIKTERQQYEKREKEFQKQIENISHDLRTPLTVILGYLKIFHKSKIASSADNKELSETLSIVEQKADIMKNLVEQFYIYTRLKADSYELTLGNVDVARTLRESLMGNYQILEQKQLKLALTIPDHPVWIIGEESGLERIFLNLFQNAGRYADTFLEITVKKQQTGTLIIFANDTNMLSADDIPYLFDRFYMQDDSRHQGGTGLGLTVAKSLAEEMNGRLDVSLRDHLAHDDMGKNVICFELWLTSI